MYKSLYYNFKISPLFDLTGWAEYLVKPEADGLPEKVHFYHYMPDQFVIVNGKKIHLSWKLSKINLL